MQTQCSWFMLNHPKGEGKLVLSICTIQQVLMNIGDKPASFVGSQEWIGSFEICLCFSSLFEILFVTSGREIKSKGKQLMAHFRDHNTPVMIGGVYTLLGLHYNPTANKIHQVLLLDPHYASNKVPQAIVQEGMVGWHPPTIFSNSMFYNFCMPQANQ